MIPAEEPVPVDARKLLEALVIDNPELEKLESLLDQFNIFEAVGMERQEIRHSAFLAFLLNPQASHGLGDAFVKKLLQKALAGSGEAFPVTPIDLDVWSLSGCVVQREWQNIDVLITDEAHKLAIIIENKIDSSEHSNQLTRYYESVRGSHRGWHIVGLYLTPEGEPPAEDADAERYIPISYALIADLVEKLAQGRASTLGADVGTLMVHYVQVLRRHIVSESEVAELCARIYQKHRRALDLILEHRPDQQAITRALLEQLIVEGQAQHGLLPDRHGKTATNFTLQSWETPVMKQGSGWTTTKRIMLFEFSNSTHGLKLHLLIGPEPQEVRKSLLGLATQAKPLLKAKENAAGSRSTRIYSLRFLDARDYEESDPEERATKIRKQWSKFLAEDLPRIKDALQVDQIHSAQPTP